MLLFLSSYSNAPQTSLALSVTVSRSQPAETTISTRAAWSEWPHSRSQLWNDCATLLSCSKCIEESKCKRPSETWYHDMKTSWSDNQSVLCKTLSIFHWPSIDVLCIDRALGPFSAHKIISCVISSSTIFQCFGLAAHQYERITVRARGIWMATFNCFPDVRTRSHGPVKKLLVYTIS